MSDEKPRCENCRFSSIKLNQYNTHSGFVECRKNPPIVSSRSSEKWPSIEYDKWCGAFEPTNSKEVGE